MDVLLCHGAQNIGLSNHKLKSALKCMITVYGRPRQTDRQTDRQTNIMSIGLPFVLTNVKRAKNILRVNLS